MEGGTGSDVYTEPHVLPRRLGGKEIGFDVCDECNHSFGTVQRGWPAIIRPQFNSRAVTEQFKRELYEVFLQRYMSIVVSSSVLRKPSH